MSDESEQRNLAGVQETKLHKLYISFLLNLGKSLEPSEISFTYIP